MTPLDREKADALVSEYLAHIQREDVMPLAIGRSWLEFAMERVGIIESARKLTLGQSHAIWYAALIKTRRLSEVVTVLNRVIPSGKAGRDLARTIRKIKTSKDNTIVSPMVRDLLGQ